MNNITAQIKDLKRKNAVARLNLTILAVFGAFLFLVIIKFSIFSLVVSILLAASLATLGFWHTYKNNKLIKQLEKEVNAPIFVDVR